MQAHAWQRHVGTLSLEAVMHTNYKTTQPETHSTKIYTHTVLHIVYINPTPMGYIHLYCTASDLRTGCCVRIYHVHIPAHTDITFKLKIKVRDDTSLLDKVSMLLYLRYSYPTKRSFEISLWKFGIDVSIPVNINTEW